MLFEMLINQFYSYKMFSEKIFENDSRNHAEWWHFFTLAFSVLESQWYWGKLSKSS